uniref:ferroxidase n=1 Tax=Heterorhabditis bacteriophora TaxID=37862 RepID=A0A1I7WRV6_HETBA
MLTRFIRPTFSSSITRSSRYGLCFTASQLEYEKAAEQSLEKLSDYLDSFPDRLAVSPDFDITNSMGVLTAVISKEVGTYVINKQSPNKQIWLSSPLSGPKRYDLINEKWIYSHNHESLDSLLTREFRMIFNADDIDFKDHMPCNFFYNVTGEEAERLLRAYGCDGEFLARPSESQPLNFTLSIILCGSSEGLSSSQGLVSSWI